MQQARPLVPVGPARVHGFRSGPAGNPGGENRVTCPLETAGARLSAATHGRLLSFPTCRYGGSTPLAAAGGKDRAGAPPAAVRPAIS